MNISERQCQLTLCFMFTRMAIEHFTVISMHYIVLNYSKEDLILTGSQVVVGAVWMCV